MNYEIKIEPFEEKDANKLSAMIYKVIEQMEKSNPNLDYTLVREEDRPEELIKASREGKMLVAKKGGKIAGTLSLMGDRLRRFFVHPDYQRIGIGRRLIENVIAYAKSQNIKEISVSAVLSAIPVYKKLGFREGKIFLNQEINQEEMKMELIL